MISEALALANDPAEPFNREVNPVLIVTETVGVVVGFTPVSTTKPLPTLPDTLVTVPAPIPDTLMVPSPAIRTLPPPFTTPREEDVAVATFMLIPVPALPVAVKGRAAVMEKAST